MTDLWGNTPVSLAIERIQSFCPPEGYWLAFSGGKDSTALYELARMADVPFEAHYNVTTVDPPELLRHIRAHYPGVVWDRPRYTMTELVVRNGAPPTRRMRYCCQELKERGGNGRMVLTGIRAAESAGRRKRGLAEVCRTYNRRLVHPILDWTDDDVWAFIHERGLPYCSLYDEGFTRVGCVMCPFHRREGRLRDAERWPRMYAMYLRAFDKMLARRAELGKETQWQTAQDVMDWWLADRERGDKVAEEQERLPMFCDGVTEGGE